MAEGGTGRSPLTIAYGRDIRHYETFLAEQSSDVLTVKSEVISAMSLFTSQWACT